MRKQMVALLAGAMLMMATSAMAFSYNPAALQNVLNGITVAPVANVSSVNTATDFIADGADAYWSVTGAGGSVATMLIEVAGMAAQNDLYVYDATDKTKKVLLFAGADTGGTQKMLSVKADGSIFINFVDSGINFNSNTFGYMLHNETGNFYSDSKLNESNGANGFADHMLAFQGKNSDTVQLPGLAPGLWTNNEYILAFEDLPFSGSDFDFNDMVIMVESVTPAVPEPGTMMLFGIGMLGMAVFGKRRMNKQA